MAPDLLNKTKVVHYVSKWLPQTAAWLYNELRFLPQEEIDNHIVCDETWGLDQFPMQNIHSLEQCSRWSRDWLRIKKKLNLVHPYAMHLSLLEQVVRAVKPGVMHSHFGHMGWVNTSVADKCNVKHVVSFYGADVHYVPRKDPLWFERYREMGQRVDQVLCEGPFMAESIAQLGIPREKIAVHRLGVDLKEFRFEPRRYEKGGVLRFLMVASFREKKGIPIALEALSRFRETYDRFELTLVGDAFLEQDKPEKERIYRTIKEKNLTSKVRLLGARPYTEVLQEAYKHHIFLAPSLTGADGDCEGGAPVAIIEMAATGMPIVGTTHCDIPFVLSKLNSPYLVSERDSVGLCDAIVRLISSDWTDMLESNRRYIEQELDSQRQGAELCQLYRRLL